ncbi:hypothetical protein NC652_005218 [Populus alba x Populus x berolinensis]|nr:hypothetical protein NC652_005218 [Populus alba x Populus x berolinensis]
MIVYVANCRYGSPTRTPHQKSQRILQQPNQIWPTDLLKQETSPYKYCDSRQKPNGTPIIRSPKLQSIPSWVRCVHVKPVFFFPVRERANHAYCSPITISDSQDLANSHYTPS